MGHAARVFSARFVSPSAHAGERVFSVRFVACGASFQRPFLVVFRGRFCPCFCPVFVPEQPAFRHISFGCAPSGSALFPTLSLGKEPGVCGLQKAAGEHLVWWCSPPLLKGGAPPESTTNTCRQNTAAKTRYERETNRQGEFTFRAARHTRPPKPLTRSPLTGPTAHPPGTVTAHGAENTLKTHRTAPFKTPAKTPPNEGPLRSRAHALGACPSARTGATFCARCLTLPNAPEQTGAEAQRGEDNRHVGSILSAPRRMARVGRRVQVFELRLDFAYNRKHSKWRPFRKNRRDHGAVLLSRPSPLAAHAARCPRLAAHHQKSPPRRHKEGRQLFPRSGGPIIPLW
jgi:hypothetical protein